MKRALVLVSFLAVGCASASLPEPVLVRATDASKLAGIDLRTRPVIIEVMPGDVVPMDVKVDGDLIGTAPDQAPVMLTARRHFFVRVSKNGLELSLDKDHFGGKKLAPGALAFGFGLNQSGPRATLVVTTPRYAPQRE